MPSATTCQPAEAGRSPTTTAPGRLVTDAPTRMYHWLLALSFVGAYLTADGERWRALHVTLGYTMAGLLAFRVLYGLLKIDLTERLQRQARLSERGLVVEAARMPQGTHRLLLRVADDKGRVAEQTVVFHVARRP